MRLRVDPEELCRLAERFSAEAAALAGAIPRFRHQAGAVEEAFGLLGPSDELYYEYLSLLREWGNGLDQLRAVFDDVAAGLCTAADNYRGAEAGATLPGAL